MKTHDLVAALADQASASPVQSGRLFARCLWLSVVLSLGLMLLFLGLQPGLEQLGQLPTFWFKLLIPVSVAAASFVALRRLGYPGRALGAWGVLPLLPLLAVGSAAALIVSFAPGGAGQWGVAAGADWPACTARIALLSVPAFVLAFTTLRAMAPTRLSLAGTMAGLFAGALGTAAYALHCPEMQVAFLTVWYGLGMLVPAVAGALLGPRLLRW